ncbi:MAG: elongation factor G [Enhygromyxa sp.]
MDTKVRNIGISAHVDSGKTTLTERILFYAGLIHQMGEIRGKDRKPKTDSMALEIEKGITIQSAAVSVEWRGHAINVIDTPGHVDFTIEVERALAVLDGAVLVLCAVGGVQSQSLTVDRQMRRYGVPCIAFINKMDRAGADPFAVLEQLQERLGHRPVLVTLPIGAEERFVGVVDLLRMRAIYFDGEYGEELRYEAIPAALGEAAEQWRAKLIDRLVEGDDALLEACLDDAEIEPERLEAALRRATCARELTPVFVGSAYKNCGVQPLLDGICSLLPSPAEVRNEGWLLAAEGCESEPTRIELETRADAPLVAFAFKLIEGSFGQLTYLRIYQGRLAKGDFIVNQRSKQRSKLKRLVRMHADEMLDIEAAEAGDIVALFGVDCVTGDTFTDGTVEISVSSIFVPEPVISYAIAPNDRGAAGAFARALNRFAKEDPTFRVRQDRESGETIISGMGELHLEVYIERMRREYEVDTIVSAPQVAYRETITMQATFDHLHKKQEGGKGQYAKVIGSVRPCADSGYRFVDRIVGGAIPRQYIPACDAGFRAALEQGVLLGAPVLGVEVELCDGAVHSTDSSELAFRKAARDAMREALRAAAPVVLEPIMSVEVEAPDEFQGRVQTSLVRRRGMITATRGRASSCVVAAEVPLAELFGYAGELRSLTQGRGEFTMEFARYAQVPAAIATALVNARREVG